MRSAVWESEPCPLDDCDGTLAHQGSWNVMCRSCETVWQHQATDDEERLVTHEAEIDATRPRVATDGGNPGPLKYRRNSQLRAEIVYTVGGDASRYRGTQRGMLKADIVRIATILQPDDSTAPVKSLKLSELYECVCKWAGSEYEGTAGCQWRLTRENLKAIHEAVDARSPTEWGNEPADDSQPVR